MSESDLTRRRFLQTTRGTLLTASTAAAALGDTRAAAQVPNIKVPPPPGKKLGMAIVGLGNLAIFQILPAFAKFPSGVLANCTSSYGAGINRFRLVGTKGAAELEPALSYNGLRMRVLRGGHVEDRALPVRDHFASEMDALGDSIVNGTPSLTPGEEGLRDLRIMMAIYESAKSGRPVTLA